MTTDDEGRDDDTKTNTNNSTLDMSKLFVTFYYYPSNNNNRRHNNNNNNITNNNNNNNNNILSFKSLYSSLSQHEEYSNQLLHKLEVQEKTARVTEDYFLNTKQMDAAANGKSSFSKSIRDKRGRMARSMDNDKRILERLLVPFEVVVVLLNDMNIEEGNLSPIAPASSEEKELAIVPLSRPLVQTDTINSGIDNEIVSSYESAHHVITHLMRDWTDGGSIIRHSLYDWCIHQLNAFDLPILSPPSEMNHHDRIKILVPGAGLGRLAYELYLNYGDSVSNHSSPGHEKSTPTKLTSSAIEIEANDCSVVMAAAANMLWNEGVSGNVHPFLYDHLMNEVDENDRYESFSFPSTSLVKHIPNKKLDYVIGDFIEIYSSEARRNTFSSVVTCFFIDTSTNIYEYILVIKQMLMNGGAWINVGPLHWHQNALLSPSVGELRSMIENMGFDIKAWEVDAEEAVNYRGGDVHSAGRYTRFEGYRPLRFVVVKQEDKSCDSMLGNSSIDLDRLKEQLAFIHSKNVRFGDGY